MTQTLEEKLEFCSLVRDVAEKELELTFTRRLFVIKRVNVYTRYLERDNIFYVGYASEPLSIKSAKKYAPITGLADIHEKLILDNLPIEMDPGKGFTKLSEAEKFRTQMTQKGYDVHIYKCFTHTDSQITPLFLEFDPASQAFLMLHEAWHTTLWGRGDIGVIDYKLNEAVGTIFGINGLKNVRNHTHLIEEDDEERLKQDLRLFNDYINKYHSKLMEIYSSDRPEDEKLAMKKEIMAEAEKERVSNAGKTRTLFFRNRYFEDSVSNATFLRHRNYNFMFDELDRIYNSMTPEEFMDFVKYSPRDTDSLRKYILNKSDSISR